MRGGLPPPTHLKSRIRRFPRTAPGCSRYLATRFLDYAYQSRDVPKRKHGIPRMKVVGPLYSRGLSRARPRREAGRRRRDPTARARHLRVLHHRRKAGRTAVCVPSSHQHARSSPLITFPPNTRRTNLPRLPGSRLGPLLRQVPDLGVVGVEHFAATRRQLLILWRTTRALDGGTWKRYCACKALVEEWSPGEL